MATRGTGISLKIEWTDTLRELKDKVPKAAKILTDMKRLAEQYLFPQLRSHIEKVYAEQGAPTGTHWPDYSDEPLYQFFKTGVLDYEQIGDLPTTSNSPGGLMRWEGNERLYPSLTERNDPNHMEQVFGMSAAYGTYVGYAERLTQSGTNLFGEDRAARPLLAMKPSVRSRFMDGAGLWFRKQLKAVRIL